MKTAEEFATWFLAHPEATGGELEEAVNSLPEAEFQRLRRVANYYKHLAD